MSQPSIKKNFIYNTLYEILIIISPLITAPYISRIFQADGVGIYSYTSAITSYFTMFAALGIRSYGQREIAQSRDNPQQMSKLFWELELMCLSTTLLCLIPWVFLIIFSSQYSVYYGVLTVTVVATAFDISWFWRGKEQYKYIVLRNSAVKIAGIACLFIFVHEKEDLLLYIALIAIMGLIGNISMWLNLSKVLVKVEWKSLQVKRHYRKTLVYFVPSVATSIYTVLDKAMLGWIVNSDLENGYYEQATKIINLSKTVVLSINTVVSSRMSFLFAKEKHDEIKDKFKTTMNFILLAAIPIAVGLVGIASNFVPFFFGEGYDKVVNIIYIMSPLIIIIGISDCLGSLYFTPSGQRARSNKAIVTGAIVNLILNVFFIYVFEAKGAAIASVIAELAITSMYIYMSRSYFNFRFIIGYSWKRIIAAGVMFVFVCAMKEIIDTPIVLLITQIAVGALIYAACLIIMRDKFLLDNIKKTISKICTNKRK